MSAQFGKLLSNYIHQPDAKIIGIGIPENITLDVSRVKRSLSYSPEGRVTTYAMAYDTYSAICEMADRYAASMGVDVRAFENGSDKDAAVSLFTDYCFNAPFPSTHIILEVNFTSDLTTSLLLEWQGNNFRPGQSTFNDADVFIL